MTTVAVSVAVGTNPAYAFRDGINGFSGKTGAICNQCHAGGTAPTVALDGPATVAPGTMATYTFTVTGNSVAAGLDVAVTGGQLSVDSAQGARIQGGEVVHNARKNYVDGSASWTFTFTAPSSAGTVTMFAAGNNVNGNDNSVGDRAAATQLMINVAAAVDTPTPSPTPTVPIGDTPTPTHTSGPIPCVGDCDDNGVVVVNELVTGVNIALDRAEVSQCPDFDIDGSQTVSVNELVSGVNALLRGCDPNL
jgi:hypothetical protein